MGGLSCPKLKKKNDLLTNIPTNNITELKDLFYARAKLISEKKGSSEDHRNKFKSVGERRLESQIRKLQQKAKILKQHKNVLRRNGKSATRTKSTT